MKIQTENNPVIFEGAVLRCFVCMKKRQSDRETRNAAFSHIERDRNGRE